MIKQLLPALLTLAAAGQSQTSTSSVPSYGELSTLPGLVAPPQNFANQPDQSGSSKGVEFSSAVQFGSRLLVSDDETSLVNAAQLRGEPAVGLCLVELLPVPETRSFALSQPWKAEFDALRATGFDFDDIEGTTTRGDRLYMLGSHSFNKAGKRRPKREVVMRLAPNGQGQFQAAGRPTELRDRIVSMIESLSGNTSSREAIDTQLNIEGFAAIPDSDDFLIGVKRPLVAADDRSVVLRLGGLDAYLDGSATELSIKLELLLAADRSGVSSMEWDPIQKGYLIATNFKESSYSGSSIWLWPGPGVSAREICRFRDRALEGVCRIGEGPFAGNLLMAFDEETIDQNWKTRDGGAVAITKWGRKK